MLDYVLKEKKLEIKVKEDVTDKSSTLVSLENYARSHHSGMTPTNSEYNIKSVFSAKVSKAM